MHDLVFGRASINEQFIRNTEDMLNDYYERSVASEDIPPYSFMWERYRSMEALGILIVTTAMNPTSRVMVGMCMYVCTEHPHHRGLYVAECDTIATRLDYRGHGVGKALYKYTEDILRKRGVRRVVNRYRAVYKTKPMFEDLGFKAIETCYMKELD